MADKKITDLTVLTGDLAGTDLIPMVEDPAGTPKTVKVPVSTILPDGGAEDAVLIKSSTDDYDSEWKAPFLSRVAVLDWRGAAGADGPIITKNILAPALYDTFASNDIPSLTLDGAGHLIFPVGKFLINMNLHSWVTGDTRLYIREDSTGDIKLAGATAHDRLYNTYKSYSMANAILRGVLTVTDNAEIYDLLVSVTNSHEAGVSDSLTFVSYECYGQVLIQQLSD